MEDHIVQLIVSVNNPRTGLRLIRKVLAVPLHKVVESGDLSDGLVAFDIHRLRLCERNPRQRFYLAGKICIR